MVADLSWLITAAPKDDDVVAGPIGFVIFVALCIAVGLLGWSLNKHLKKAHRAADEGVYDDPAERAEPVEPAETGSDNGTGAGE